MDWNRIAADFRPDGSLRDIYVHGTGPADWQQVLDALRGWTPAPTFTLDGEPAALPERVVEIFHRSEERAPMLSLVVGGMVLNCHFFIVEEIEFDLDPAEVTGPACAEALAAFMSLLGKTTNRPVTLTMENTPDAIIFRYSPDAQVVKWASPRQGEVRYGSKGGRPVSVEIGFPQSETRASTGAPT